MAKKLVQKKKSLSAKKEDRFEWVVRIMKEGLEEVETNLRKEMKDVVEASEGRLRTEVRHVEENLQFRHSKSMNDLFRDNDTFVKPKIANHERRIKRLEHAPTARV